MSNAPHIYLFSGLGADERVFKKLTLPYNFTHVHWVENTSSTETIEHYSKRLTEQITHKNPILIGVSFGGLIAIEIATMIPVEKVIIISSAKRRSDIPWSYRMFGNARMDRISPAWMLNKNSSLLDFMFGVSNKESKELLHQIVKDTNPQFMKWSISKLVGWQQEESKTDIFHIHGDNDRLIPAKGKIDYTIKGGSHFMIYDKAEEVSNAIDNILNE